MFRIWINQGKRLLSSSSTYPERQAQRIAATIFERSLCCKVEVHDTRNGKVVFTIER